MKRPPISLEQYTRVLASLDTWGLYEILTEMKISREAWRIAAAYWGARVASEHHPQFSPGEATRFRVLMANETRMRDRVAAW